MLVNLLNNEPIVFFEKMFELGFINTGLDKLLTQLPLDLLYNVHKIFKFTNLIEVIKRKEWVMNQKYWNRKIILINKIFVEDDVFFLYCFGIFEMHRKVIITLLFYRIYYDMNIRRKKKRTKILATNFNVV